MATAAYLPFVADRVGACVRTIVVRGLDFTGVTLGMQVRSDPDTPGAPLINLGMAAAGSQGIRLVSKVMDGLTPVSTIEVRISEETMKDASKVPYRGEIGTASVLAYDLIATLNGDKRRLLYGEFVAVPTTYGSDAAVAQRYGGAPAGRFQTWGSATLAFVGDTVTINIDGVSAAIQIVTDLLSTWLVPATGPANNTVTSISALRAAATTNKSAIVSGAGINGVYSFLSGNYTGLDDGVNVVASNSTPIASGAWVLFTVSLERLLGANGSALIGFQQAGAGAVLQSVQDELRRFLTPEQFGCKVDGTTDDSTNFAKLVAAVNASPNGAAIGLPTGVIKLSTTNFTFTKPVTMRGQGVVQTQILCYSNARLSYDGTRAAYGSAGLNSSFVLRDVAVLTDGIHTSSPIHADFSPSTPAGLSPTLVMDNVFVGGRNATSGFQTGIEIVDCPWPRLTNVVIVGDAGNDPSYLSGYGIKYTGGDGSPAFRDVRVYNVKDAIWIEGEMEGVVLDGIELVAVTRGVTYLDTTNGLQPMLSMSNCHINAREYDVKTVGVTQFAIGSGNLLYGNGGGTSWTAIDITPSAFSGANNALVVTGRMSDLTISGATSTATTKTGIRVRGTSSSIEDFQILGNRFESLSVGIQLDAGTNNVFTGNDNTFRNVLTPYIDNGNGNFREQRSFTNSAIGTTDSAGRIGFAIPTTAITFDTTPFVLTVPGDGGGVTANVIQSSITTTGFTVQIANNGAAVAAGGVYRINYTVAGN